MAHPAIRHAVVGPREAAPGDMRLVAWIVPHGEPVPVADLRRDLQAQLPDSLLPNIFIYLPALPLTPNGKLDRAALPAPQWSLSATGSLPVAARTPLEEVLCVLFAELLGRATVGVHDDFFAHGGHSLLATRLVARIRDALQVALPLRAIFTTPTPAGIAAALQAVRNSGQAHASTGPLHSLRSTAQQTGSMAPLSAMQQRLWFLDQLQPGSRAYHLPWAARLRGRLDRRALQAAVDALVARHAVLRTRFVAHDGVASQQLLDLAELPANWIAVEFTELVRMNCPAPCLNACSVCISIWLPVLCCACGCCRSHRTISCWCWSCITSSRMAGRCRC